MFESNFLKTNKDITTRNQVDKGPLCGCANSKSLFILFFYITSQSHEILQPFVWHKLSPPHTNFCKILATLESFFFARFQRITFKLSKITNIKALFTFQWCRRIFRHGHMSKVEKNRGSI